MVEAHAMDPVETTAESWMADPGADLHALRRTLAATGSSVFVAAQKAGVVDSLQAIVTASQEQGHGVFMDSLHLVYGGRMSARDLVGISSGAHGTCHHPAVIERLIEGHGIRETIDMAPNLVGLELDEDTLMDLSTERLVELLRAPLLERGLDMDEARLLFGDDFVQQEDVEGESVRHMWIYTGPGLSEEPVLELRFEEGRLMGWKDSVGKGRAIHGASPRLESSAEIPHFVGGFHLAALSTCIVLMEQAGKDEAAIDAFIDTATQEIRTTSSTWPSPELQTLTAIGDRYIHDRIRTDEAADRLEHYADRFANYDPEGHIVPREAFIEAAMEVLRRVGGLEKRSTVPAVIYWVVLTLLILTSLAFLIFRAQLKAADAWPDIPIEDDQAAPTAPLSPDEAASPIEPPQKP